MGQLTITQTVAGTLSEATSHTFRTTVGVSVGTDITQDVTSTWIDVAGNLVNLNMWAILYNSGSNPARYRVTDGTNFARFDLPAGRGAVVQLANILDHGVSLKQGKTLAVWSALGTTVRVLVFA